MYVFRSIKDIISSLSVGRELLSEMFGKRKALVYKYDQAVEILEENKLQGLIEKGVLTQNGNKLEIEDQFLSFFEQILEVNEEINISYINENIQQLKENINYFLQEDSENRKYKYLKSIKSSLKKIGRICLRNIVDLNRNIENTFKSEPNFKIKISKLKNYDVKRSDIGDLIKQTEQILVEDEITFFRTALDEELKQIVVELQGQLHEANHNLIEVQKQIIDFLNQVKYQSRVIEKLRQIKHLKDQFELEDKSNIREVLMQNNALVFESRSGFPVKLSLESLQDEEVYAIIKELNRKLKTGIKPQMAIAETISMDYLASESEEQEFVNIEEMKNNFMASGNHLFDFVLNYDYQKEVSKEEKLIYFCQLLSTYEEEMEINQEFAISGDTEFVIVYPKGTRGWQSQKGKRKFSKS